MPIYEYVCKKCDNEFEYLVFSSSDSAVCPKCEDTKVERKMSACSFKSSGSVAPSAGASSCSGCSSSNCSSCG